jgi:PD-(D/E)XK nuclease superfamily protein
MTSLSTFRGNLFLRVQCKTAREVNGCISFNSRTTDHGRGRRSYLGLADMFGVYFPPCDGVFLVPVSEATGFAVRLRLQPARNNQKRGVRNAADFEFDRWTVDALQHIARGEAAMAPSAIAVA